MKKYECSCFGCNWQWGIWFVCPLVILCLSLVSSIPILAQVAPQSQDDVNVVRLNTHSRDYRKSEVIVKFKTSADMKVRRKVAGRMLFSGRKSVDAALAKMGIEDVEPLMPLTGSMGAPRKVRSLHGNDVAVQNLSQLYCLRLDGVKVKSVHEAINSLQELSEVEFAEPNYLVYTLDVGDSQKYTADPLYSQQWGSVAINLPALWDKPVINRKKPVIAILDTGVDITHPDLKDNIWVNAAESTGVEGADDDGNGFVDDINGWDFVNQTGHMRDNNGHGTHCAGIAAAVGGNGVGITGANPDACIMPVTVMQSDGVGDVATIIKGIDYAVANGANVISMSIGGYTHSIAEEQALARAYASAVLVAAAGNDKLDIYPIPLTENKPCYPAAFTFVFGVEASGPSGSRAYFSNYDPDGPTYFDPTFFSEEQMYNYELMAPGVGIYSTFPGGGYRSLSGTSMACPLVAGAISRLLQTKDYASKEILFGDLIHSRQAQMSGNIDILAAYELSDADRQPELSLVTYSLVDSVSGDGDGRPDAGETLELYPTLRNQWGQARHVKIWLELGENEDPDIAEILTDKVDFGKELSSYAKDKSTSPLRIKINPHCVDGRQIKLTLHATCDNVSIDLAYGFILTVENGVEIGGMIEKDMTLYPNVHYIVTRTLAVPDGVTLTIKPGTVLKFKDGAGMACSRNGHIIAVGTPDSVICMKKSEYVGSSSPLMFNPIDTVQYVELSNFIFDYTYESNFDGNFRNVVCRDNRSFKPLFYKSYDVVSSNVINNYTEYQDDVTQERYRDVNIMNNSWATRTAYYSVSSFYYGNNNVLNNIDRKTGLVMNLVGKATEVINYKTDIPSYYGTSREDIARKGIRDIEIGYGFSKFDLSNMLTRPNPEAHGIVWKVLVNGYDAQDQFEELPPLGVGKHKFEVWYSKAVNKALTPTIAMGVRPPYTQTTIAEDGSWNEAGDVYTAYLTVTGKMAIDGLNRIYVSGGEDLERFEIPLENTRFNVNVSAAGSMSTGFVGEAGLGKVSLSWKKQDENVDDILGYNIYRYQVHDDGIHTDSVRLNEQLIEDTAYVDYGVVPAQTYCYYYKIMRTNLAENSPSSVVAVTPLTATKGDANGSMTVDVADVVTEISYLTNQDPRPFIFEAADVNSDSTINILDVVGTINIILAPKSSSISSLSDVAVTYTVEHGVLYLDSPIALGGVQCRLTADCDHTFTPAATIDGFETVGQWTADGQYLFLAYSMNGKTMPAGKYPLLNIGSANIDEMVLSDTRGKNVVAVSGSVTGIGATVKAQMRTPYPNPFTDKVTIPYVIGKNGSHKVRIAITDLTGRLVQIHDARQGYGEYSYTWRPTATQGAGLYLAMLYIDGVKVQTSKLVHIQ